VDERIGSVAELWRYPVKSMRGEQVGGAMAGLRGLAGDRHWAVIDSETGRVASAKRPKLWLTMLQCTAAYVSEPAADGEAAPVQVTVPDGHEVLSDDPDCDRLLSEALGRPVTLQSSAPEGATYELAKRDAEGLEAADPDRLTESPIAMFAPQGTFFDTSTLHIIASSSLDTLARAHPAGQWEQSRFRPNVVVALDDASDEGFAENGWIGQSLGLGADTQVAVLGPMPRCVMTTVPQGDLPRDPRILRTIAEQNRQEIADYGSYACVGVMANVLAPGTLALEDAVSLSAALT
jgi:uncharacterized protein YcbX